MATTQAAGTKTSDGGTIAYSGSGRQYVQYGVGDMGSSGQSQSAGNTAGPTATNAPEAGPQQGIPQPVAPMGPPDQNTPQQPVDAQQTGATAYNQAQQGLATAPVAGTALAAPPPPNKYQVGLATAQQSGTKAPADAGQARSAVQSYLPPDQPDTSGVDTFISGDSNITKLMQGITQLLNPQQQTTSLLDDYNSLYKQSGLDQINKEIIDADTVINGTEDDIRNEIQGAGGFGTDSQVQAMSLARNKGLIKRYNQLVQMKTDATNQLNTLSQLNAQDKQMAQTKLNTQIDGMFKLADFAQQAQTNIQEGFNSLVGKVGYAGAYQAYSHSPVQLANIEKVMGLAPGGLQELASQPDLDRMAKQASISASNASTAKSYSDIAKNNADITATQNAKAETAKAAASTADTVLGSVTKAMKQVNGLSSGFLGGSTSAIPGSPSKNLQSTINTIKSNLAFTELAKMRAASQTGGALGQISDKEEELLSSTVASLDVGQNPQQLKDNLQAVQTHYVNYLTSLGYGYDAASGNVIQY